MGEFADIVYVFKERADDAEPNGVQLDIEGDLPEKKYRPSRSVRHTAALFSREGELKYTAELGFFANWDKQNSRSPHGNRRSIPSRHITYNTGRWLCLARFVQAC